MQLGEDYYRMHDGVSLGISILSTGLTIEMYRIENAGLLYSSLDLYFDVVLGT